ncbi:glycosyltransferase [Marinobacterium aestuariivivens]|uniref:Glycosyltransferase n=1 Tax=Marinobacterium aestuariivivens TaxID=1698799 RepID=A0ABW1ZUH9_9GAMM
MANQTAELCRLLEQEGARVTLIAVNPPYRPAWIGRWRGLRALFRLLPYLRTLWRRLGSADVVHLMANSGWSWYLFATPAIWIACLRGTPVVVNYRGATLKLSSAAPGAGSGRPSDRPAPASSPRGFWPRCLPNASYPHASFPTLWTRPVFPPGREREVGQRRRAHPGGYP